MVSDLFNVDNVDLIGIKKKSQAKLHLKLKVSPHKSRYQGFVFFMRFLSFQDQSFSDVLLFREIHFFTFSGCILLHF